MPTKHLPSAIPTVIKKLLLVAGSTASLVILLPVFFSLTQSVSTAQSISSCQCTDYVARRFGLTGYPHAGDWNDGFLARNGFQQVNYPQPGAIVVMERSFPGANPTYGHVGVVETVRDRINGPLKLDVRGANQGSAPFLTENNCNNVKIVGFGTNVRGRTDISYWVRNQITPGKVYKLELKATPPNSQKYCIDVDGTKIGIVPNAQIAKVLPCRTIGEQQFKAISDENNYYRFELQATPPNGTKYCLEVNGTKIGILPDAFKAKVGTCRPIQEQQFKLIQDGNNYVRFELRATPSNGVKQCLEVDGTKIGTYLDANNGKVGQCRLIQEQQFSLIRQ